MRDYDELVNALRMCDGDVGACWKCPRYGTDDCHGVFGEAADAIEELLAAVPKWISVEERLPDDSQDVLVFFVYGVAPITGIEVDSYNRRGKRWVNMDDAVTHWMPLPSVEGLNGT